MNLNNENEFKKTSHEYDIPDLNVFLNKEEIENLNEYKKISKISKISKKNTDEILNKSLREIINIWSKTHMNIINDITIYIQNINKYSHFFYDIEKTDILKGIYLYIKDFILIFTKNSRSIYVGFTFILLSLLFFFIGASN